MSKMQMVDLLGQYNKIKNEVDAAILDVVQSSMYINGPEVKSFQDEMEQYLDVKHVVPCANGTDALQIAMMALQLQPGDEVIVPSFTFVATAEVIALLHLKPVMVDVDLHTFNMLPEHVEQAITPKTKAIVPVHLFGQSADMGPIMELAAKHNLYVIEDNAQAIGSDYTFADGRTQKTGGIGHVSGTSFFPSKNLGCYGDGGAVMCQDDELAARLRLVANHGMSRRYYHDEIGINSRLDSIQAAILRIKLRKLDEYNAARRAAADRYDAAFADVDQLVAPKRSAFSSHVFHQYTLRVTDGRRDALQAHLMEHGFPAMIYYPVPMYKQEAFKPFWDGVELPVTEQLSLEVISLPMHSELTAENQAELIDTIRKFFGK
ncbi:MAG: DegT/DnrJ/EryC1/StrS family aminotransferase [Saprospiraceae bacterium]